MTKKTKEPLTLTPAERRAVLDARKLLKLREKQAAERAKFEAERAKVREAEEARRKEEADNAIALEGDALYMSVNEAIGRQNTRNYRAHVVQVATEASQRIRRQLDALNALLGGVNQNGSDENDKVLESVEGILGDLGVDPEHTFKARPIVERLDPAITRVAKLKLAVEQPGKFGYLVPVSERDKEIGVIAKLADRIRAFDPKGAAGLDGLIRKIEQSILATGRVLGMDFAAAEDRAIAQMQERGRQAGKSAEMQAAMELARMYNPVLVVPEGLLIPKKGA